MTGYLIFSLKKAIDISNNKELKKKYKRSLFLTDRVIIFSLLKNEGLKVILLQEYLNQKKFNKIFLKNYEKFNFFLKTLDKSNFEKSNLFYNSFRYLGSRDYVGIICLTTALKAVLKKQKFKEIILFLGFKGAILSEKIYLKIFDHFFRSNKVNFNFEKSNEVSKNYLLKLFFKIITKLKFEIINFSFFKLKILLKKYLTKIILIKKNNTNLIIEPAFDLNYLNFKINETLFKNFNLEKNFFKDDLSKDFYTYNKKNTYLKIIQDHFNNNIQFNKRLIYRKTDEIQKFISKNKVKKIFWGVSPNPLLANILENLKKKNLKIYGTQHGGKYLTQHDDIYHKDSDYFFCNNFLAYGISKYFNKSKFAPKTKIIKSGTFKSFYIKKKFNKINKKKISKNFLYIPISSSFLIKPFYGSMEVNHYLRQKQICEFINKWNKNKSFVKIISQSIKFGKITDELSLEHNPLNFDLSKYKNLIQTTGLIPNVLKKLKPKIIICDSFSTSLYEIMLSHSEIVLFLDQENLPKKDVMKLLSKRVFLVKSVSEMKLVFKKIIKGNVSKAKNNEFINKFYLSNHDYFHY